MSAYRRAWTRRHGRHVLVDADDDTPAWPADSRRRFPIAAQADDDRLHRTASTRASTSGAPIETTTTSPINHLTSGSSGTALSSSGRARGHAVPLPEPAADQQDRSQLELDHPDVTVGRTACRRHDGRLGVQRPGKGSHLAANGYGQTGLE